MAMRSWRWAPGWGVPSSVAFPSDFAFATLQKCLADARASFTCPITYELFIDPVRAEDGQIYERAAIATWLQTHDTSPNTGVALAHKKLVSLPAVRSTIELLVDKGAVPHDEVCEWLTVCGQQDASSPTRHAQAKKMLLTISALVARLQDLKLDQQGINDITAWRDAGRWQLIAT